MTNTNESSNLINEAVRRFNIIIHSDNKLEILSNDISLDMIFAKIEKLAENDINVHPENICKYNRFMNTVNRYKNSYQGISDVRLNYLNGKMSYEDMINKMSIILHQNQKKEVAE